MADGSSRQLLLLLILMVVVGCAAPQTHHVASICVNDSSPLGDGLMHDAIWPALVQPGEEIKRLECCAVPGVEDVYVVIYDWDPYWWGSWAVVGVEDGAVVWHASIVFSEGDLPGDDYYDNSYAVSARALNVEGYPNPLIEVFDSSHMGNGAINLFALDGQRLVHLLSTRAYDSHGDTVFRGGELAATYADLNGDGAADLVLSGIVDTYVSYESRLDGGTADHTEYYQASYIWTPDAGRFIEVSP